MQNNPTTPKKSTLEQNITGSVTPENRVKVISTKNVVETEHPVYKTKILVVTGNEPELDYAGIAKSKISEITKILPINIPRSLVAILFMIVVIPIIFSPGIFMPDFSIAGGDASMSQLKFPETIFRNLNFDNRDILKAQLDTLVASYERKLAILDCDCNLAQLLKSRIKIAQAIWENASDDLFLDFMMAQISDIKTKPYFSHSNPCFSRDHSKINTHFSSLGKWAQDADQMDFERQVAEFMTKYPEIFEKANFDRLENVNAVITQAVAENAYVIKEAIEVKEIKTIAVEKKAVKKHKRRARHNKSAAKPKTEKAAESKTSDVSTNAPAPAPVEAAPAPVAVEPAPAPEAPAPAPAEPKKEEPKKAKDSKKDKKAKAEAPAAPAQAPDANAMPPAPDTMPAPADAMTPADPTMPAPPAEPVKTDAKGAKKPAKIK